MRAIPPSLLAHYASGATTLARLWHIARTDDVVLTFTDHDQPIPHGGLIYKPTSAFDASAIETKDDMSVANLELQGLLAVDGITAEDIESGLWDGAKVTLYEVDWHTPEDAQVLRFGEIGEIQRKPGLFVAELRGLSQKLQNVIGRIVRASCDAELGDERCKVDLEALRVAGVVTATIDARDFTAAGLTQAAGYFTFGIVTWTTGANAGRKMEIKRHVAGGVFELALDMSKVIAVGDHFTVTPGCNKIGRGPLASRPVGLTASTFAAGNTADVLTLNSRIATVVSALTFKQPDLAKAGPRFATVLIKWTGGANTGTTSTAYRVTTVDDGSFTLSAATAQPLAVGDLFLMVAAASAAGAALPVSEVAFPATGDCVSKFDNYINFRGFEDIPGDKIYLYGGQ